MKTKFTSRLRLPNGTWIDMPTGCTFNGRSEIKKGSVLLHFTDGETKSDFTVPEASADATSIHLAQQRHRMSYAAASTFAPIAF